MRRDRDVADPPTAARTEPVALTVYVFPAASDDDRYTSTNESAEVGVCRCTPACDTPDCAPGNVPSAIRVQLTGP